MKRSLRKGLTLCIALALLIGLWGCAEEGPAEKAGKKIDKAVEQAGEQMDKAAQKVRDIAK